MRAVWFVIDRRTSVYLVPRALMGSMMELTASLFVGLRFLWKPSTQTVYSCPSCREDEIAIPLVTRGMSVMCRGSDVKDTMVTSFQLESLILAQNERWRQA